MAQPVVVIHERLATWSRQLRPRLGSFCRCAESRSAADLARILRGEPAAVVLVDLADDPAARLADVIRARREAADALILVLDPHDRPGVATLARELGATRVLAGFVPPPDVAAVVAGWVRLVQQRERAARRPRRSPDDSLGSFRPRTPATDRPVPVPASAPSPRNPA